jgi:hypothetical protein
MYEEPTEIEVVMPSEIMEVESSHDEGVGVAESEEVSTSEVIGPEQQSQGTKINQGQAPLCLLRILWILHP